VLKELSGAKKLGRGKRQKRIVQERLRKATVGKKKKEIEKKIGETHFPKTGPMMGGECGQIERCRNPSQGGKGETTEKVSGDAQQKRKNCPTFSLHRKKEHYE